MTDKWQTPALVVEYLDTAYPQALTVATLVTYTGRSETTVRKALKELVLDGEVVKDGIAYRRPLHETGSNAIGPDATFLDPSPAEMDATMREQISSPVIDPDDPDHINVQHDMDEHVVVEGLEGMVEARQTPVEAEAGTSDQPEDVEASEEVQPAGDDKRKYRPRRDNPDRPVRVNQKTGSKLQVVPRVDFEDWSSRRDGTTVRIGEDIVTFPWYTICHTHSTFVGTKKIMAAWAYSTNPESFCHGCKEVTDAGR